MGIGYIFIDQTDNRLKVKKPNGNFVEFPVDLSDIQLLYAVYSTDTTTTDATVDLHGGTILQFTQPLNGLTFSNIENSHNESQIIFTWGNSIPDIVIPASIDVIGEPYSKRIALI